MTKVKTEVKPETSIKTDIDLLNRAMETFNSASETVVQYYNSLEERVRLLTDEVDHKKQLLNSILDSIDAGVVFFDNDGIIKIMNSASENLLNVNASDTIGGRSIHAEINNGVITPKNGRPFYAISSYSDVMGKEGDIIGNVLIFKDITRLKQLELENERNRRLGAMGELVVKIAHEIRNPLGSMELFASLLSCDLKGTKHGDYANRISNSVRSLVNTLDNMLKFTREIKPNKEYCCLNSIINEICDEFRELFLSSNIKVQSFGYSQHWVSLDKGLIKQALINIMLNSIYAMPDGGELNVIVSGKDSNEEGAMIAIKDSGIGMDEDTKQMIFEPFFSTKDRGTGLGLSITAAIIKAHDGTIDVRSEAGKGAEFVIALPITSN